MFYYYVNPRNSVIYTMSIVKIENNEFTGNVVYNNIVRVAMRSDDVKYLFSTYKEAYEFRDNLIQERNK